ncbi:hypothetical protein MIND_01255100 [Mycena indigotica]|uniref:Hydroxyneurosporene synthase n=1 Tax=Mycena indigotica TaxID=2126181 RepID=A0A8H6S2N8_9AGAR|nr:uncharacterized protein MIND_01255100 [Mycena indigotica]KAF7291120.1 hypothetical protein MIND_01255100 [Mycena indigotica]
MQELHNADTFCESWSVAPMRLLSLTLSLASSLFVAASLVERPDRIPFDGQYLKPNASNTAVEWWWGHAIAEPTGNNPPAAFQYLFYQGYPFALGPRDPTLPEFYIVVNGFFPNGTRFSGTIPATSGTVTSHAQEVAGSWGGAGSFRGSPDLSTFTIHLDAPEYGFVGSVKLTSRAAHHFGCNTTSGPYFESILDQHTTLSAAEEILFTKLGWAISVPGAVSEVDMKINGARLRFTGQGYHDANWAPAPLNTAVDSWFFGTASVGDYDLSYISVSPSNSTRTLNTGYLAHKGIVLQNQCSLEGTKSKDRSVIKPYGLDQSSSGVPVPTGFIIDYILGNGEMYSFNLSSVGSSAQNPDEVVYHRWVGQASGGKVGGVSEQGLTVFEWLNPGLVPYSV